MQLRQGFCDRKKNAALIKEHLSLYRFDKLFSIEEARELIPTLELLVGEAQSCARDLRTQIAELLDGDPTVERMQLSELVERYPELKGSASRMAESVRQIESHGCFLKDIDLGLVDFPWEKDEENVVFLCWQPGEPKVVAWHPVEGGFAQRQPLPGAGKQYLN
jgi:hypothetical protein